MMSSTSALGEFFLACQIGNLSTVNELLKAERVDPSAGANSAIQFAAHCGHLAVVKRLLEDDRVDPSAGDNYAIRGAARNGHIEVVNRLLEDDQVDPSADDNYAIREAARNGHIEVVKRLLEDDRVDPSANNNFAIQQAGENGHIELIRLLVWEPHVYQVGGFDLLHPMAREMASELYRSNSMPFDFASLVLQQDLDVNVQLSLTLQAAHNDALGQVMTVLHSGAFAESLQQDVQCRIVWMSFGHLLFPLFPEQQRHDRIALLVEFINLVHRSLGHN